MQSILCEKSRGVLCIEGNYTPAKLRRTAVDAMGLFAINSTFSFFAKWNFSCSDCSPIPSSRGESVAGFTRSLYCLII